MSARYSHKTGYTIARRQPVRRATVRTVERRVKFGPTTAKYIGLAILGIIAISLTASKVGVSTTQVYNNTQLSTQVNQEQQKLESLQEQASRLQSLAAVQSNPDLTKQYSSPGPIDQISSTPGPTPTGQVAGVATVVP